MVVVDDEQVDACLNEIVVWLQVEDVQTGLFGGCCRRESSENKKGTTSTRDASFSA